MASDIDVKKSPSQYDGQLVLKLVHDAVNQSLRVSSANTSVPSSYSRVDLTYNADGSVTNAKFYGGFSAEKRDIEFKDDVSSSLNNTYFPLYSEYDESSYIVWYNVDGAGTDPNIAGFISLEVPISADDDARVIRMATEMVVDRIEDFEIKKLSDTKLRIINQRKGNASETTDSGGTGFDFETVQQGTEKLIKSIDIPYDGIVKYIYNEQEKKFEVESVVVQGDISAEGGDTIAVSRHQEYRNILDSADFLASALDTTSYTQIWSYTAAEDLRVRVVKAKADTLGVFRLKIDGDIQDYFFTSSHERNCRFSFVEDLDLPTGSQITLEFVPERIRLSSYNFFFRMESYTV